LATYSSITGMTAGLILADPHVMPYFRSHAGRLDDLNDTFDAPITTAEGIALPASLMVAGYVRHDQYAVSTAFWREKPTPTVLLSTLG
jgi:hypothetical protein